MNISLNGAYTEVEGHFESRQSVLGLEAASAPVGLQVEELHQRDPGLPAQEKTSLDNLAITQRGRNREEAVLKSGFACGSTFLRPHCLHCDTFVKHFPEQGVFFLTHPVNADTHAGIRYNSA